MEGFREGAILLEKYRIERVIGQGGMGLVLKVTHLHLGEELAIKVLSPEIASSPDAHARFLREAQAVVRLRGEHVARAFDVGVLPNGALYMVMEYLAGRDLSAELARRGALFPPEAVDYVLQACEALAEAHANGIVHRDVKPNNLFLTARPDGTPLIKVLDFGISKAPSRGQAPVTRTDTVMGTQGYMSPEQMKASRDVDARTDIWALGVVLYECLAGRPPFVAESFSAFVLKAATEPPPPLDPRIPRGLQAVLLRCLEKDRNARFPTVAALAVALAPFAGDQRAAATIVDRTRLMSRGPAAGLSDAAASGPPPMATTLSGSAGASMSYARRRRIGIIAVFGSVIGISIGALIATSGGRAASAELGSSAEPTSDVHVVTSSAPADAHEPAVTVDTPRTANKSAEVVVGAAAAAAAGNPDEVKTQVARCSELASRSAWLALDDCATALASLGAKDSAATFHDKAVREVRNEHNSEEVARAIRDVNLKAAQAAQKDIGQDSVYYKSAQDAFIKAESQAVDQTKRAAQNFVNAHDCIGLRRYYTQLKESSTERVAQAVDTLVGRCAAQPQAQADPGASKAPPPPAQTTQPPPPASTPACDATEVDELIAQAKRQYSESYPKVALTLMQKALACRQDFKMYSMAAIYACAAHDINAARRYFRLLLPAQRAPIEQRCQQEHLDVRCDPAEVEEQINQAKQQGSAGYAKAALTLMQKALACRQDIKMYQLAATYACSAHDLNAAKLYFHQIPPGQRAPIVQRCQQEHLDVGQ